MNRIGIDLGGTKIEGVVLDASGKELFRSRIATERNKGYEHILERIHSLYGILKEKIGGESHTLGIGTPGAVSYKTGFLKNSNTVCLSGRLSVADLEKTLGKKLAIENDANCFALAETMAGAGKGKKLVFGVIMGTGCGGGIVHEGKVIRGLQSIAGEWGHMSVDPNGPKCYCGQRGCVETLISGTGVETRYKVKYGRVKALKEIVEDYRKKDPDAVSVMRDFFRNFGRSLANLVNVLDPDMIVLGGGVSNIPEIYEEGIAQVQHYVFSDSLETPIVRHALGDSAGVIGAALIGI